MEGKRGLVRQRVNGVVVHVHAVGHIFHYDAALCVGYYPVQKRCSQLLAYRLAYDGYVFQGRLHLAYAGEVRGDPFGELVGGNVGLAVYGCAFVLGVSGEVEACHGQPRIVSAVEEQRVALVGDAHANGCVRARRVV